MQQGREIRGLNERFRFYRYTEGQVFRWHHDGYFERDNGEQSVLTFLIYLNEDYLGGETNFEWTKVKGKTGMGLIFPHHLVHQGNAVLGDGVKYVIRTDVMYGRVGNFTDVSRATYFKSDKEAGCNRPLNDMSAKKQTYLNLPSSTHHLFDTQSRAFQRSFSLCVSP
jgi:predicted 2-oxoglutarate/Fe(II)-dependent dioxygenase YbiX